MSDEDEHGAQHEHAVSEGNVGGTGGSEPIERDPEKAAEFIARSGRTEEDVAEDDIGLHDSDAGLSVGEQPGSGDDEA